MDNFLNGFVHEFCPKIKTFFYQRFTQDLYQKKSFFDILKRKQSFLDLKNLSFKKGQKMVFFQRSQSMDFVQKSKFLLSPFLTENMSETIVFRYFGKKNNHFETKKLKFQQGLTKKHFSKGLVNRFCPKIELFLTGVFHRNHIRKDCLRYCGKKRMILRGKN